MKDLKYSTKAGQKIYEMGSRYEAMYLNQIYDSYSQEKQKAYDWCYEEYLKTENHDAFSICSHNNFGFTCSWVGTLDGEYIMRFETSKNSYLVWLDR